VEISEYYLEEIKADAKINSSRYAIPAYPLENFGFDFLFIQN